MQEVNHEQGVKCMLAHDGRRWGQAILVPHHWHEPAADRGVTGGAALLCGHPE